jgi:hypothetical protein
MVEQAQSSNAPDGRINLEIYEQKGRAVFRVNGEEHALWVKRAKTTLNNVHVSLLGERGGAAAWWSLGWAEEWSDGFELYGIDPPLAVDGEPVA